MPVWPIFLLLGVALYLCALPYVRYVVKKTAPEEATKKEKRLAVYLYPLASLMGLLKKLTGREAPPR